MSNYKFENITDSNSNLYVKITVDDINVIHLSCKGFRVQMIENGDYTKFQVRGDEYNNIFQFDFSEVSIPVATDNQDLFLKITDVLNCCQCQ